MRYIIGIEGGGTESTYIAADFNNNILSRVTSGGTNITASPLDQIKSNIHASIKELVKAGNLNLGDCKAVCMGTAGVNRDKERMIMEDVISSIGIDCPIKVVNDSEIALAAATGKDEGIIVIAGTGSIAYGKNSEGISCTAGGWGHLIGDEGSGYWIAKEAINRSLKSAEGIIPYTRLTQILMEHLGILRVEDFIGFVYHSPFDKRKIAALGPIVDKAYQLGDYEAKSILVEAADGLVSMTRSIIGRLGFEGKPIDIVIHGSVITKNQLVNQRFSKLVTDEYPLVKIIVLEKEAAYGAVSIAKIYT